MNPFPAEAEAIAAAYQHGRSLDELAREFGVHRRTAAHHLERLGVARRVNPLKLPPTDNERAVSQYRAGDSLATVAKILNVEGHHPQGVRSGPAGDERQIGVDQRIAQGKPDLTGFSRRWTGWLNE
jgi:hypothetical protein